ncbi:MAG: ATP-dependent Clp protease adaptor ClpS [Gemmataceae bacterium]
MSQQHSDRPLNPSGEPVDVRQPALPHEQPRGRHLPRYKVILHHNSANDLMYVVRTVMELTRLCRAEATHKMWEAYHCGRSLLLITHKERAELYAEQFISRNLPVSLEPA